MAVINATKVSATTNELTYTFTGAGADTGTITYATLVADAFTGTSGTSTLKTVLSALAGQCDSNAKAISALITGEQFTGAGAGTPVITTNIEVKLVASTGTAIPFVIAVDDGATNNPAINFGTAGAGQCWLYINRVHSIVL
jgi:hypothetical protein